MSAACGVCECRAVVLCLVVLFLFRFGNNFRIRYGYFSRSHTHTHSSRKRINSLHYFQTGGILSITNVFIHFIVSIYCSMLVSHQIIVVTVKIFTGYHTWFISKLATFFRIYQRLEKYRNFGRKTEIDRF